MRRLLLLLMIILIAVLMTAVFFAIPKNRNNRAVANPQPPVTVGKIPENLNYEQMITPEDRAPIVPQPEIINQGQKIRVPILMYHHIGVPPENADATRKDLTVSPEEFEQQVAWLSKAGYSSVTLDDLYRYTQKQTTEWPTKPVIFTFDDGYTDVFENAVPILQKYSFTGVFGIITGFVGQTQGDNLYANWVQIANAKASGMEMVCHTQNHFDGTNPKFDDQYILNNLTGCQNDLAAYLGLSKPYLIYPYGHYTESYLSQAKKAGFLMGFTVHGGSTLYTEDLMRIPRVRVHLGEPLEKFIERLNE